MRLSLFLLVTVYSQWLPTHPRQHTQNVKREGEGEGERERTGGNERERGNETERDSTKPFYYHLSFLSLSFHHCGVLGFGSHTHTYKFLSFFYVKNELFRVLTHNTHHTHSLLSLSSSSYSANPDR